MSKQFLTALVAVVAFALVPGVARADSYQTFDGVGGIAPTGVVGKSVGTGVLTGWVSDRYTPAVFETGGGVLNHGVAVADFKGIGNFYTTQGMKFATNLEGDHQMLSIDLFVGSGWQTDAEQRNAGLWGVGENAAGATSAYPILAYREKQFQYYDYNTGLYHNTGATVNAGEWNNLKVLLNVGSGVDYYINGVKAASFADAATVSLSDVILNVYNYGKTYSVQWNNFEAAAVTPTPVAATAGLVLMGLTALKRRRAC